METGENDLTLNLRSLYIHKTLKFVGLGYISCHIMAFLFPRHGGHQDIHSNNGHVTSSFSIHHVLAPGFSKNLILTPSSPQLIYYGNRCYKKFEKSYKFQNIMLQVKLASFLVYKGNACVLPEIQ